MDLSVKFKAFFHQDQYILMSELPVLVNTSNCLGSRIIVPSQSNASLLACANI